MSRQNKSVRTKKPAGKGPTPAIKSPLRLAETVYQSAQDALETYSSVFSKHDFTQAQLFTLLVLRVFFKTDYRGIIDILADFSDLRRVLELDDQKIPHHTTLVHAEKRLLKKRPSKLSCSPYFSWLGNKEYLEESELFGWVS